VSDHKGPSRAGDRFERREFLKKGLGAASLAALATGGIVNSRQARGAEAPTPAPTQPGITAMTVDGQLVQVPAERALPPGLPRTDPGVRQGVPGRKWVMVYDLAACDGCQDCVVACNEMHNNPADQPWINVYVMEDSPETAPYWFPRGCFHCDNPPCTKVCPVNATFKRQDGIVLIDNEVCIGCRFCMAACPYSARVFNWERPSPASQHAPPPSPETQHIKRVGTVSKCDFCPELAREGLLPPCVTSCSMGAVYYGDELEDAVTNGEGETLRLSRLLEDRSGFRQREELGTEPRVYYLPPVRRRYAPPPRRGGAAHTATDAGEGT